MAPTVALIIEHFCINLPDGWAKIPGQKERTMPSLIAAQIHCEREMSSGTQGRGNFKLFTQNNLHNILVIL